METVLNSAPTPQSGAEERLFQCSVCKRSFTRVDHLMRHVRSHTKQRPHICPHCSKSFARVDLLKRHVGKHASDNGRKRSRIDVSRQSRVVQACEECSRSHLRCEDEKPCSRCRQKNLTCRLSPTAQTNIDAEQELDAAQDLLDLSHSLDLRSPGPPAAQHTASPYRSECLVDEATMLAPHPMPRMLNNMQGIEINCDNVGLVTTQSPEPPSLLMSERTVTSFSEGAHSDNLLPDFLRYMPPLETSLSGFATPRGIMEHSFHWDLDFSGFTFSSFDHGTIQDNFHTNTSFNDIHSALQHNQHGSHHTAAADRSKAFDQSVWRYVPGRNTNPVFAGESNLALPNGEDEAQSPLRIPSLRITKERMSYITRDRLLALVLNSSSAVNSKRIASGFPSLELLDGMVQIFFTAPSIDAAFLFHLPSFSPAQIHPLLLACIVATGAFSTSDGLLQKLGLALHETARVAINKSIEEDNSSIRDIQFLQMQLLLLELGMWSGMSRNMEICESLLQLPITMLRRGGRFGQSIWNKICPDAGDEGPALQEKWKEWVLQESWIKLVYRFFEFDRQSSMALLKPPLISYAEMKISLLQPDHLWQAPSAAAWKAAYLSTPAATVKRPTLYDCIEDPDHLSHYPAAGTAYLYMLWGMVWEFRQLQALTSRKHFVNDMLLSSRQQELTKLCEDFGLSQSSSRIQEQLIVEAMLMHLNAPLDDVQIFAGIAGPEEARHTYPSIRDWASTDRARQSLWHASQILKISHGSPQGTLQNFYAMVVYHAALVLWVYGLLERTAEGGNHQPVPDLQTIVLGQADKRNVRRFIKLNRGEPAIRNNITQADTPLRDAAQVIRSVSQLLRHNHGVSAESSPPLVESLLQLMEVLRSASK